MNTPCYIGRTSTATGTGSGISRYARISPDKGWCARRRHRAKAASNTLLFMTNGPGRVARALLMAAEGALVQAAFGTGEFTAAERLFGEARAVAAHDGDQEGEARALGGLGMT